MKVKNNVKITDLSNAEAQSDFINNREQLKKDAKKQISKIQNENRKTQNLRRRKSNNCKHNNIVAIKHMQQGPGLKLKLKYLGPYKVLKAKIKEIQDVKKVGFIDEFTTLWRI